MGCISKEKQTIDSSNIQEESNYEITNIEETSNNKGVFNGEDVISKMEVKQYKYVTYGFYYSFMEVANNSNCTVDVDINILYYDENDNLISAESMSEDVLMPGHNALMFNMLNEDWFSAKYELTVSEPSFFRGIQDDITYEVSPAKNKLVVTMTNNGNEAAESVEGRVLFFKGEEIVGYSLNYFCDDDFELKPGKSISKNLDCYEDFDGYKIYVTGYR